MKCKPRYKALTLHLNGEALARAYIRVFNIFMAKTKIFKYVLWLRFKLKTRIQTLILVFLLNIVLIK